MSDDQSALRANEQRLTAKSLRNQAQDLGGAALSTLAALVADANVPPTIRLAAAREVLDRGYGRPKPARSKKPAKSEGGGGMTVIVKRYSDVTDEELARAAEGEP